MSLYNWHPFFTAATAALAAARRVSGSMGYSSSIPSSDFNTANQSSPKISMIAVRINMATLL
jgi:hypothetical protein